MMILNWMKRKSNFKVKLITFKFKSNRSYKVIYETKKYYIIKVSTGYFNSTQRVSKKVCNIKIITYNDLKYDKTRSIRK